MRRKLPTFVLAMLAALSTAGVAAATNGKTQAIPHSYKPAPAGATP